MKRGLTKDITCLKDFINDPKREEPLVGMLVFLFVCFLNAMSLYSICVLKYEVIFQCCFIM